MELERRRAAKRSLPRFTDYLRTSGVIDPEITPTATFHQFLLGQLERVSHGLTKRLMIFMPPGYAKTTYASIIFPAWYMGNHPRHRLIGASHTGDLADESGRSVRNIVDDPSYQRVFGFGLSQDTTAAGRWNNSEGGRYYAAGVGGAIAGRRAHLGIIDDPLRGHKDADSEQVRHDLWNWYLTDFRPRLLPGAAIIIIQTRWHEDDLAGRILDPERRAELAGA